jgi:Spy/CpxP family protein refolding chaperone
MFGFLVGTACLIGLFSVVRHGRRFGHCGHVGYGGGYEGFRRGWGRHGQHDWGWRGDSGRPFFLRSIFERLDTTPGQEKAILAALDELKETARAAKGEMRGARSELAQAMRTESFDEVALGGATARVEGVVDTARKAGIAAFAKIHQALDDRQRQKLADIIESGPGFGRWGGGSDHPFSYTM